MRGRELSTRMRSTQHGAASTTCSSNRRRSTRAALEAFAAPCSLRPPRPPTCVRRLPERVRMLGLGKAAAPLGVRVAACHKGDGHSNGHFSGSAARRATRGLASSTRHRKPRSALSTPPQARTACTAQHAQHAPHRVRTISTRWKPSQAVALRASSSSKNSTRGMARPRSPGLSVSFSMSITQVRPCRNGAGGGRVGWGAKRSRVVGRAGRDKRDRRTHACM